MYIGLSQFQILSATIDGSISDTLAALLFTMCSLYIALSELLTWSEVFNSCTASIVVVVTGSIVVSFDPASCDPINFQVKISSLIISELHENVEVVKSSLSRRNCEGTRCTIPKV